MSQSRRNRRMSKRLGDEARNTLRFKRNAEFIAGLNQENQLLQAMATQQLLTRKIRGNIIKRYFNWAMGINPMLQIMDNRAKLQEGISNASTPDQGGSDSG